MVQISLKSILSATMNMLSYMSMYRISVYATELCTRMSALSSSSQHLRDFERSIK